MINFLNAKGSSLNLTFNQFVELKSTNTVGKEMVFEGQLIAGSKVIEISTVGGITWIRKVENGDIEMVNIKFENGELIRSGVTMSREFASSLANF